MVGKTISHYKVLEKIGEGGMGEVYLAEDSRLGRNVALKFLPEKFAQNSEALERFQREARALSALNHPNISAIYDIGEHEGQPFIVMEFLEGQTLLSMIQDSPLPTDQLLKFAAQIAEALEAAHSKGVIHRDIKPANVFVTESGSIKLVDFGLAKLAVEAPYGAERMPTNLTAPGIAVGTPYYMSPEQLLEKELDARSDIFSFGVLLYEMATSTLPFTGQDIKIVFNKILNSAPTSLMHFNPDLAAGMEAIINKALEKDRQLRYQSAADLRADVERLKCEIDGSRSVEAIAATGPSLRSRVLARRSVLPVTGPVLLETKLYIPKWRPGLVSRPRLIERMHQGIERKLTLVSAPAGFGKTTLLAEWVAAAPVSERPVAWVSLDQGDNDPRVLLGLLHHRTAEGPVRGGREGALFAAFASATTD